MFVNSFEKIALSLHKAQKMIARGVAKRTGESASKVHRDSIATGARNSGLGVRGYIKSIKNISTKKVNDTSGSSYRKGVSFISDMIDRDIANGKSS